MQKFEWLAEPFCGDALRAEIVDAVDHLDRIGISELTSLLGSASFRADRPRSRHRF